MSGTRELDQRQPSAGAELVFNRSCVGCIRGDLSIPPNGPVGLRAEVARTPDVPENTRRPPPPSALDIARVSARVQGSPQGCTDRPWYCAPRRSDVSFGSL